MADKPKNKGGAGPTARPPGRASSPSGQVRAAIEQRSAVPLIFLSRLPRWALPLVLVGLLIAGLAGSGWLGTVATAALMVTLGWLGYLSWPRLSRPGRVLRVAAFAVLLVQLLSHLGIKP